MDLGVVARIERYTRRMEPPRRLVRREGSEPLDLPSGQAEPGGPVAERSQIDRLSTLNRAFRHRVNPVLHPEYSPQHANNSSPRSAWKRGEMSGIESDTQTVSPGRLGRPRENYEDALTGSRLVENVRNRGRGPARFVGKRGPPCLAWAAGRPYDDPSRPERDEGSSGASHRSRNGG